LLQHADLFGEVALQHRRVVPLRVLEGLRDDELRHRVHLLPERAGALHRRPRLREALVGHPAQELRVARLQLVELEAPALVADLEGPAAVRIALGPAGVLDDTIERDELGDHDPAHVCLLPVVSRGYDRRACRKSSTCARIYSTDWLDIEG